MGKEFLSLLPDEERRDVFQKICLKLPVSNTGIDFFSNGKFLDFKKQVTLQSSKNKDIRSQYRC